MNYTAKQIDNMSIEEIDELAQMLNEEELNKWASNGFDGASYVKIIKSR
jgi:succinate dehydrogenase flavin-adding protein (antitoxin of CptAB toxin-antitoxin module)